MLAASDGVELAALEQRADDRPPQHEDADAGGDREQCRHPDAERRLVDERRPLLAGDRARHLRLERGGDRHGEQAVGEHEERERGEVRRRVAGSGFGQVAHDDERDLVGGDEPDRPERQLEQPADGGVAEVERRAGTAKPVRIMAGTSTTAIEAIPSVAPRPSVNLSRSSDSTSSSAQSAVPASGSDSSVAMMITLGRIGLHAAAKNRRRLFRNALARPTRP